MEYIAGLIDADMVIKIILKYLINNKKNYMLTFKWINKREMLCLHIFHNKF